MRKRNGFTLVEIISVIGILLIISAVAIPSIVSMNKRNKQKNYERIVDSIITSSENFIERYRSDVPFNETTGEYYFQLNVLGSLNLLKLPITDPRDNSKISNDSCVKVTKQDDGSLNYEFPASECNINASNPELVINEDLTNVRVGSTVNLKQYIESYSSNNTPKRYLKLEIGRLDTSSEGNNREVTYTLIDLLNGLQTQKTKSFNVLDDREINVVFLRDSVTKTDLTNNKISDWKNSLSQTLNNGLSDIDIKTNITTHIIDTTGMEETVNLSNHYNYEGQYSRSGDCVGVYDVKIDDKNTSIIQVKYNPTGSVDIECLTAFFDIFDGTLYFKHASSICTLANDYNIFCRKDSNTIQRYNLLETGLYIDGGGACHIGGTHDTNNIKWNRDANLKSADYTELTKHVNPEGISYPSETEIKTLLEKAGTLAGYSEKYYTVCLKKKHYRSIFYRNFALDGNKYVFYHDDYPGQTGYLIGMLSCSSDISYETAILWHGHNPEKFSVNFNKYQEYDKTYLIITANNTNNYVQEFNIVNTPAEYKPYLFADQTTLDKINIKNSQELLYTNIDTVLTTLKDKIK